MPDIALTQGQRIRLAREWAGLDQADLAEMSHIGRSTISNWENDLNVREVSFNNLKAIADATGRPVEFFLGKTLQFTATVPEGSQWQLDLFAEEDQVTPPAGWHPSLIAA